MKSLKKYIYICVTHCAKMMDASLLHWPYKLYTLWLQFVDACLFLKHLEFYVDYCFQQSFLLLLLTLTGPAFAVTWPMIYGLMGISVCVGLVLLLFCYMDASWIK